MARGTTVADVFHKLSTKKQQVARALSAQPAAGVPSPAPSADAGLNPVITSQQQTEWSDGPL
jgi:hypothetical protein